MNICGTHWMSITASFVVFGIILIVRGPDALALVECCAVVFSLIVGVGVGDKLAAVKVWENDAFVWRERCKKLEQAIRDHERLEERQ